MSSEPPGPGSKRRGKKSSDRQIAYVRWIGLALIAAGGGAIAFGWSGMARVNCADCQLPYLLSGGAAGLALVIVGASLFVIAQLRSDRTRQEAQFAELIDALTRTPRPAAGVSTPPTPTTGMLVPAVAQGPAGSEGDLMVAGRSSFHRQSCRLVHGKTGAELIPLEEAMSRGLSPCGVCMPAAQAALAPPAAETEGPVAEGEEPASVDTATETTPPVPVGDFWAEELPARPRNLDGDRMAQRNPPRRGIGRT